MLSIIAQYPYQKRDLEKSKEDRKYAALQMKQLLREFHHRLKDIGEKARKAEWQKYILQNVDQPHKADDKRYRDDDAHYPVKSIRSSRYPHDFIT